MGTQNNREVKEKRQEDLVSTRNFRLPPVIPGPEVKDLSEKVNEFYESYPKKHKKQKPSELIEGAFYAAREECRSNPDWMSQAANSLRDLLYPLFSRQVGEQNAIRLFKEYANNQETQEKQNQEEFVKVFSDLNKIYRRLTDIAHHGTDPRSFTEENEYMEFTEDDFESLLRDFVSILRKAFSMQQVYVHVAFDLIMKQGPANKEDIRTLLEVNADARQYFYNKAGAQWLEWLWHNGFLDVVKEKIEKPTQYSHKTPELSYLVSVAEDKPGVLVEEIILDKNTVTKEGEFNPEVIDTFLRACEKLPAEELKKVVPKVRDENWVKLMGEYNHLGYLYQEILETLSEAGEHDSVLTLSEALLSVKPSDKIEKVGSSGDNPFYVDDLSRTEVFDHVVSLEDEYAVRAFEIIANKLEEIISALDTATEESFFDKEDSYLLSDVDFFEVRLDEDDSYNKSDNVRQLFLTFTELARNVIGNKCYQEENISEYYKDTVGKLPHSKVTWRFKLFALSLCRRSFIDKLNNKLFELFETNKYFEVTSRAEYEKTLKKTFPEFFRSDKNLYIDKVIKYFHELAENADSENEKESCLNSGSRILSVISPHLTENQKQKIESKGFELLPNYRPGVSIEISDYGFHSPKAPISQEEFDEIPVSKIVSKLKSEWSAKRLNEQEKGTDFKEQVSVDGVAKLIKNSISSRLQEFVDNAKLFFEPGSLDTHYTYSFLQGIRTKISEDRGKCVGTNWDGLIELILEVKSWGYEQDLQEEPKNDMSGGWRANWKAVHSTLTDVLQEIIKKDDGEVLIDFDKHRDELFLILEYLLQFPYPQPEDEAPESATQGVRSPSGSETKVSNPFDMAINSVRGSAFKAFVYFVYRDGKELKEDVKAQYEALLEREKTRALYFMFGHYLPTFYFRDEEWFKDLLPQIFPEERNEEHLYLAAWEGYLANKLYKEIFFVTEFQDLYESSIENVEELKQKESHRHYFKDPEERTADHLALAHMYFEEFGKDHPLFELFLNRGSISQHAKFISFLGRHFISNLNESSENLLESKDWPAKRLKEIWEDWLVRYDPPEVLEEFGRWVNDKKGIFAKDWHARQIRKTIEKLEGDIDWDYELAKSITDFAKAAPEETLQIAKIYLLQGQSGERDRAFFYHLDEEWLDAFRIMHENPETESDTEKLINELIAEGGKPFWVLKEVLEG